LEVPACAGMTVPVFGYGNHAIDIALVKRTLTTLR
jgi:hypothetical protein